MSIRDEIAARCQEGRLFHLQPALHFVPVDRCLLYGEVVRDFFENAKGKPEWEQRLAQLRADLDHFTSGGPLVVALEPYRMRHANLGRLAQPRDNVWDLRVQSPVPGLRLFGRFADIDTFIALGWGDRAELGNRHSAEWRKAVNRCKHAWRSLFPAYDPVHGETVNDFLTNAIDLRHT